MTKKNKGGRLATVLDGEQIAQVEALGSVLSLEQIADYFGVSRVTFSNIMERQPEVAKRYKMGKARAISSVAQGLLGRAQAGDTASAIFYLKTQAGWKETTAIDVTQKSTVKVSSDMTPQEAAKAYQDMMNG